MGVTRNGREQIDLPASNTQIEGDKTATWANSAGAGTEVTIDFGQLTPPLRSKYRVQVHNPSTVTALTIKVYDRVNLGGAVRNALLATLAIAANAVEEESVESMFGGTDGVRLVVSNDTALGLADGFTANIAVREA
jgi:hypothetical protein